MVTAGEAVTPAVVVEDSPDVLARMTAVVFVPSMPGNEFVEAGNAAVDGVVVAGEVCASVGASVLSDDVTAAEIADVGVIDGVAGHPVLDCGKHLQINGQFEGSVYGMSHRRATHLNIHRETIINNCAHSQHR
jgi:hypothetical protein